MTDIINNLTWTEDVWYPEPDKKLSYRWADVTNHFEDCGLSPTDVVRLSRWPKKYSISVHNKSGKWLFGVGQIDPVKFESDPDAHFTAVGLEFSKRDIRRSIRYSLLDVLEKHHGHEMDF